MLKRRCIHQLLSNVTLYSDVSDDATEWIQRLSCDDGCLPPHGHCYHGLYVMQTDPRDTASRQIIGENRREGERGGRRGKGKGEEGNGRGKRAVKKVKDKIREGNGGR